MADIDFGYDTLIFLDKKLKDSKTGFVIEADSIITDHLFKLITGKTEAQLQKALENGKLRRPSKEEFSDHEIIGDEQYRSWMKTNGINESTQRLMGKYIFDEKKVYQNKEFVFTKLNDCIAFGMFLPKDREVYNRKGQYVGMEQAWSEVLITSKRELLELSTDFKKKHLLRFDNIPDGQNYPKGWKLNSIHQYLTDKNYDVSEEDIFNKITATYKKYLYFGSETWYKIHSLWDMATYFFMLFRYFPLFELRGMHGTAKSKVMDTSRLFTFNSTEKMINPSESVLFRITHANRPTKYVDEAERLYSVNPKTGKVDPDPRVELINSSYHCSGTVPRNEKVGDNYVPRYYKTYSPSMIGSINGLYGATEDRAIVHIMTKAPDNDPRGDLDPDETDPSYTEIKNDLYVLALQNWQKVESIYKGLKVKELKNRDLAIWKPILTMAQFIDDNLYAEVLKFAKNQASAKKGEYFHEDSTEFKLLYLMRKLIEQGKPIIYVKEISQNWFPPNDTYKPAPKTMTNRLDRLGFRDHKGKDAAGAFYEVPKPLFDSIVMPLCPAVFLDKEETVPQQKTQEESVQDSQSMNDLIDVVKKTSGKNALVIDEKFGTDFVSQAKELGLIAEVRAGEYSVIE